VKHEVLGDICVGNVQLVKLLSAVRYLPSVV
jgi:hypothetical protein